MTDPQPTPGGSTEVIERPDLSESDPDEGRLAHIGRAAEVSRAYVTGEEITALCGKRFVPSRDPDRYPVCPRCAAILSQLKVGRGGSN